MGTYGYLPIGNDLKLNSYYSILIFYNKATFFHQ